MATYFGRFGTRYTTQQQLGAGGEGSVYSVSGYNGLVAKIYKPDRFKTSSDRATMERKLKAMIGMNIKYMIDGTARFAWPQDILYENNVMVGFIMPEIQTKYKIYDVYRGGTNSVREKIYPDYTWKYSVQFAYHLAWLVNYLHTHGIVIGDFNQNNISIDSKSGTVIIIDCDSFDITDPVTGEHFGCGVGLPEMLAPELQTVGNLANATFTKQSDYFSLAIHIFRLLMDNADPFGGIITTNASISNIPANKAICNGECVYVRQISGKKIPDWSQKPDMLPPEILSLFSKTFNYTALSAIRNISNRATAIEWCSALEPYGKAEPNLKLKKCSKNIKHVYPAHNSTCPWCAMVDKQTTPKAPVKTYVNHTTTSSTIKIKQNVSSQQSVKTSGYKLSIIIGVIVVIGLIALFIHLNNNDEESFSDNASSNQYSYTDENNSYQNEEIDYSEPYETQDYEYLISGSDSRYITDEDLYILSKDQVQLARNEIFARHGRKFKTDWIRNYFEATSWYEGTYDPDYFDNSVMNSVFNKYEKENVKFILEYEKRKGYS